MKKIALKLSTILFLFSLSQLTFAKTPAHNSKSIHPGLKAIKKLIDDAVDGKIKDVTYITAGDSKRDSPVAGQTVLYPMMFKQLNIRYCHEATSNITAEKWLKKPITQKGLANTLANITGDGEHTIVELSLGGNDHSKAVRSGLKSDAKKLKRIKPFIKAVITKILDKKPKTHIFLISPIGTERPALKQVYRELASRKEWAHSKYPRLKAHGLYLIESVMDVKRDNPKSQVKFCYDQLHPNTFGAMRILYDTINKITSKKAKKSIKWDTQLYADTSSKQGVNLAEGRPIDERNFYLVRGESKGKYRSGNTRKSVTIPIISKTIVKIEHGGDSSKVMLLDKNGNSILKSLGYKKGISYLIPGKLRYPNKLKRSDPYEYKFIYVPKGVAKLVINLTTPFSKDKKLNAALKAKPLKVYYATPEELKKHPTYKELVEGLNIDESSYGK